MIKLFGIMGDIMNVILIYADKIENQEHHELKIYRLDWFLKRYWYEVSSIFIMTW